MSPRNWVKTAKAGKLNPAGAEQMNLSRFRRGHAVDDATARAAFVPCTRGPQATDRHAEVDSDPHDPSRGLADTRGIHAELRGRGY